MNKKVATLASKAELKAEQDKVIKFQVFDSSHFRCKGHFEDYLVFHPVYRYFNKAENTDHIFT